MRRCSADGSGDVEIAEMPGEEIRWLAASPAGDELLALASEPARPGGALIAIALADGKTGSVLGAPARCYSPVLLVGPRQRGAEFLYSTTSVGKTLPCVPQGSTCGHS